MYRLLRTSFMVLLAGVLSQWTVSAQDKAPAPPAKDPPPKEKPKVEKPKDEKPKDDKAAKEEPQDSPDEQTLKAAKLPTDGPGLLEFFRTRSLDTIEREKITQLVEQLR